MSVSPRSFDKERQRLGNSRRRHRLRLRLVRRIACPRCRALPSLCRPITNRSPGRIVVSTSYFPTNAKVARRPCCGPSGWGRRSRGGIPCSRRPMASRRCRGCSAPDPTCTSSAATEQGLGRQPGRRHVRRLLGPMGRLAALHRSAAPAARRAEFDLASGNTAPALVAAGTTVDGPARRQQFNSASQRSCRSASPPPPIAGRWLCGSGGIYLVRSARSASSSAPSSAASNGRARDQS